LNKNSLLTLSDATKIYRSGDIATLALNGVDLEVCEGEFIAIVGQSGSGKSTLLAVLGLLDSLEEGSYKLANHSVHTLSRKQLADIRCKQIGFVFQFFHLLGDLTIIENIKLPMSLAGLPQSVIRKRSIELLEKVGLSHREKHFPNQLSGGQQQRVAIARALANKPSLLLVDEPTGNLDSESGKAILELLVNEHREGKTLIIVTHDLGIAKIADRVLRMHDGKLYASDSERVLSNQPVDVSREASRNE